MSRIEACSGTPRLYLSPLDIEDAAALQFIGSDPDVLRFIPGIPKPFDAKSWVTTILSSQENYICHVVRERKAGAAVGYVQINRRQNLHLQLGYWFGRSYWGQGFATESVAAAVLLFFAAGGQGSVFAAADPSNAASTRVLSKLGFKEVSQASVSPEVAPGMVDHVFPWRQNAGA